MSSKIYIVLTMLSVGNVVIADSHQRKLPLGDLPSGGTDILQGKRLFFESHERALHETGKQMIARKNKNDANRDKAKVTVKIKKETSSSKNPRPITPSIARYRLRYDGLVKSANALGIIVNGLPCHWRLGNKDNALVAIDIHVDCPSLKDTGLKLILLANTPALKVMHGRKTIAIIYPGQSL